MEGDTFYNYLRSNNTENINWFKIVFGNSLEFLPQRVCSSKTIWGILLEQHDDMTYNYTKSKAFREAFGEYFKWKLNKVKNNINYGHQHIVGR
jgi:hypothetical protein